jgi:putative transposase
MARLPRLDAPLVPQHVVVRGVDRQACFRAAGDYDAYLDDLMHGAGKSECAIHAYVLMTNHFHLLVTGSMPGSVSRLMQCVGRRYVHRFNASWSRTGTLFEGRFRASLVESDRYLLTCMRYVELNPVRAAMVANATDYRWSSVHANSGSRPDCLVTPHERYRALGSNDVERSAAYRFILGQVLRTSELEKIRQHLNTGCALGSATFQAAIARTTGRRAHVCRTGRPPRANQPRPTAMPVTERWIEGN